MNKEEKMKENKKWGDELLFFYFGALLGWLWEAVVYWISHTPHPSFIQIILEFRGVLHCPWVPIYGIGCVLVCLLAQNTGKRPLLFFFVSSLICGAVEYVTSWLLETIYQARWWDYSNQMLNLNGRISALSVLFFSAAGSAAAFLLKPAFDKGLLYFAPLGKRNICVVLTLLFLLDCIYSLAFPNMGIGVNFIGR